MARLLLLLIGLFSLLLPPAGTAEDLSSLLDDHRQMFTQKTEEEILLFIEDRISGLRLHPESRDFSGFSGGHSFSRNIETALPGAHPSTLVIAAPVKQGGLAAALALALLEDLAEEPPIGLRFLFLGGEDEPLGSRLFLQDYFPIVPTAVLYLDIREEGEFIFQTGGRGEVAPAWMLKKVLAAASQLDFPGRILGVRNQAFRFGLADTEGPAGEYLQAGLPIITVETVPAPWENPDPAIFGDFFRAFLRESAEGFPPDWDRHYIFLPFPAPGFLLEEPALIGILIIVLSLSFLYPLFFRRYFFRYLRTFRRNFWNLPLFFLVVAFFLFLGTMAIQGLSALRDTPDLYTHSPLVFFALKLSIAAFSSALSFRYLRKLPISKNGSFYSAAAIFTLFVDVLIFSLINLSYGYYFVWAYLAAILFSIFKKRALKFLFFFAAPLALLAVAYDTFTLPEPELIRVLINSPIKGNFLSAFILLPFFLMLLRLDLLIRHRVRGRSGFGLSIFTGLFASFSVLLWSYVFFMDPYRNDLQPLEVQELIDLERGIHRLSLSSPSPLGDLHFSFGGENFHLVSGKREASFDVGVPPPLVERSLETRRFLDRESYSIHLTPALATEKIDLVLESSEPFLVYDANFPLSPDPSGKRIDFHIGRRPPIPLEIALTLPEKLAIRGHILYYSPQLSREFTLSTPSFRFQSSSLVRDSFILRSDE